MEKIKIDTNDARFEIESIRPISTNIIEIVFIGGVPEVFGDITVYNGGGIECCTLPGYSTIYRDEGRTVYLSNDGSVYIAHEESPGLPPEPYQPTIDEVRKTKLYTVISECNVKITSGFEAVLSDGKQEHFSLTETDQINLQAAMAAVQQGATTYPYHADEELCRLYSAEDIIIIGGAAMDHKFWHTTYCNHLSTWIRRADSIEELETIHYGTELPADLVKNMAIIVSAVTGGQNEATK
jgi:hypothetical protein